MARQPGLLARVLLQSLYLCCCLWGPVFATAPTIFIFGDSLVDVGNNNHIPTLAKANVKFNGLDVGDGKPTGRFCNGYTSPDVLATSFLNRNPPPAYLDPSTQGAAILGGVNYASAAAGILDSTGYNFIGRIPLDKQLSNFVNTKVDIESQLGVDEADALIEKALFLVVIGSNDYINNYLLKDSQVSVQYTTLQYQHVLVATFNQQLLKLYTLGARKIGIFNVGPLGCIPREIFVRNTGGGCWEFVNSLVRGYNAAVAAMVGVLQKQLPESRFVLGDAFAVVESIINNPATYGFNVTNVACCGRGKLRAQLPCTPVSLLCDDRRTHVFWDPYHPTQHVNEIIAQYFYSGSADVIKPVNLKQLIEMPL